MKLKPIIADKVLLQMLRTTRARRKVYGSDYINYGAVMAGLSPRGWKLETDWDHIVYHFFSMIVVKQCRFMASGMTHLDSIHDAAVYGALLESFIRQHPKPKTTRKKYAHERKSRNK